MANRRVTDEAKIAAVTTYLATGNVRLCAAAAGVSYQTAKNWRLQPWFKQVEEELRQADRLELTGKLKNIVDKSLVEMDERLANGDWQWDPKTSKMVRVPLKFRDVQKAASDLIEKQSKLRQEEKQEQATKSVEKIEDRLKMLAEVFAGFSKGKNTHRILDGQIKDITPFGTLEDNVRLINPTFDEPIVEGLENG